MNVERRAGFDHLVGRLERGREGLDVGVRAVASRVHVGEVEHRADEIDLRRDREYVIEGSELAHAPHHLDPERHEPVLRFEPCPQVAELLDNICDCPVAFAAEEEARVEDDHLGAGSLRKTRRVIEHAERHLELLLALDMSHERGERCVHREHDVLGAKRLAERRRSVVVEPEAAPESDLAGPIATGREEARRLLERGRIRES